MDSHIILKAIDIRKHFSHGQSQLDILKGIDLEIKKGEALCILGSSGAGKSTLLQILGSLDRPDHGKLIFNRNDLLDLNDDQLSLFRSKNMGFVFQFHHLLSELTALENVVLPAQILGEEIINAKSRALEIMSILGVSDRQDHYPSELSGGELQRVAISRALINSPQILFADEPTGNLDSANAKKVQEIFFQLRRKMNLTLVVVTHDLQFAQEFDRTLRLKDGQWV
jgi:lipoprotein-releasing system ATP-binding protein